MGLYCQNCGALNTRDQARCNACFQSLELARSLPPESHDPPWSKQPTELLESVEFERPIHRISTAPPMRSASTKETSAHNVSTRTSSAEMLIRSTVLKESAPQSHLSLDSAMSSASASTLDARGSHGLRYDAPQRELSPSGVISSSPALESSLLMSSRSPTHSQSRSPASALSTNTPIHDSISPRVMGDLLEVTSRTLAPERLAQLYDTPKIFLFGADDNFNNRLPDHVELAERAQSLIKLCEDMLTPQVSAATIFIAFELPPRSWLQALQDLRPDEEILIWLPEWPEGQTGSQLSEIKTSAFFYGPEGLLELAITLYRLAPFSQDISTYQDPWWAEVHLRASLIEIEHFQRLLTQEHIDPYLVTLCSQRMRRWARTSQDPLWVQLAQLSLQLSDYLSQGQNQAQALNFAPPVSVESVFHLAEELLCHELLKRPVSHRALISVACVSSLKVDHPQLGVLLESFGADIKWFKHPQALLDHVNKEHFHWCFLTECIGPWDGFDLAQEVRNRAPYLKISISVFARRTHVLARAEHLNIDLLLYPSDYTSYQVITLNRALKSHSNQSAEGIPGVSKRLGMIQDLQSEQSIPIRTGLVLIALDDDAPWLPWMLQAIGEARQKYMVKSLGPLYLTEEILAFSLAFDEEDPVREFLASIDVTFKQKVRAGVVINQGLRLGEETIADALRRLQWSRDYQLKVTLGWWRNDHKDLQRLSTLGAQVLIVDSDPTNADLLKFFCEQSGLMVNVLSSGADAIELLKRSQYLPQLVMIECMLPYFDGFQVLEACQGLSQGTPRIIMTSTVRNSDLLEKAFSLGASDFIYKPYDFTEAIARITNALAWMRVKAHESS